jgi:hypothetical protein
VQGVAAGFGASCAAAALSPADLGPSSLPRVAALVWEMLAWVPVVAKDIEDEYGSDQNYEHPRRLQPAALTLLA